MKFIYTILIGLWPVIVHAQDVPARIDRLRSAIMPLGFSIGGLMAVITLMIGMFSDKLGWGPFLKVLVGIGTLAVLNGFISLIKTTLGGV